MAGYIYIITNQKHGTLYIGVTSDLARRIYEYREGHTSLIIAVCCAWFALRQAQEAHHEEGLLFA